jgi:integrase
MRFIEKKSKQKRKPVTDRTKESYWRYKNNLDIYLAESRTKRLYADQINEVWLEKYLDWLIDERGFCNDYANNNVELLKSVLKMAEETGFIARNLTKGFKLYNDDNYDTTHLTMDEIDRMANIDFHSLPIHPDTAQSLREEADCFIFSCFTAQHHADLQRKDFEVFTHPQDGRKWVRAKRVKTGNPYTLPLHPIALAIIDKYGGIENLPVKANTKRNEKLKEIAAFCGISKHLSTKIGRKTFANYALNTQRMRKETIAAILGHKTTKFIDPYARITEESIAAEYKF